MEDYKWTRGLSRSTVSNVLECEPEHVVFVIGRKMRTVQCRVEGTHDGGVGLAICSCIDEFDERIGKNIAARRAVLALVEGKSSRPVRMDWHSFPDTWTKKRINHIKSFDGMEKCTYVGHQGRSRVVGFEALSGEGTIA